MALQGVETKGTVIISSSITHVTNHKHHPQMNSDAEVVSKSSWIGRVEDMQVCAQYEALPAIYGLHLRDGSSSAF